MAASLPRTQILNNNAVYEKYFHQVESSGSGRVLAADAALFLKRSGLPDLILSKIWDLADADRKGYLNKQEFFVALRLVACAQNGMDVTASSLSAVVPPPRFHDTGSPSLLEPVVPLDLPWAVKPEEKAKYDAIFNSLNPVKGFLSGDKVKPVLLNSKLPVDILGRVWELSDIDHDGLLDRDEFAVAMLLVYSALEKEPVPMSLPPALVPPSKRKASSVAVSTPLIPPPPMPPSKEPRQPLPQVGIQPTKPPPAAPQWVVSHTEKNKYDEIFQTLDKDMDGLVSGIEVREIFLKTGLPSALLAHIWTLCDTNDCGKLSKEQFALAFYFINQRLSKGIDPPHLLTPEMIPPSERIAAANKPLAPSPVADFSAIKELDSLNNEIVDLQREKTSVEQELNEKEEAVKRRTNEVQDLQEEVERESNHLQKLQAQKQEVQEVLEGLDKQKQQLECQLQELRLQCAEEEKLISSLRAEITNQESQIYTYEDELKEAKEELSRLQEETVQLEENLETGKSRLEPLEKELHESQQEIRSVQEKLKELKVSENHFGDQLNWCNHVEPPLVNGNADHSSLSNSSSENANLHQNAECETLGQLDYQTTSSPVRSSPEITHTSGSDAEEKEENPPEKVIFQVDPFDMKLNAPTPPLTVESGLDFFQSDPFVGSDPFKDDPFGKIDPFGGDPFKDSDPFASDVFFKQLPSDPFTTSKADPFAATMSEDFPSEEPLKSDDPFAPGGTAAPAVIETGPEDPFSSLFGNESFGSGFADFSTLSKPFSTTDTFDATLPSKEKNMLDDESSHEDVPPALPPKTGTPTRPCPPPPGKRPSFKTESSGVVHQTDPFQPFNISFSKDTEFDAFTENKGVMEVGTLNKANTYQTEDDLIEWAKRESEREEEERLARLKQQEQEDLELAIALSTSEISEA
ncbi:epidermal growth factor receptor substrate 15 isoform X2 [Bombina bombina]|uniref:epidermal growth factor receptor substrate 15 isoform X2 n=1 Tax=Bombina bombina TaxID=8345 RepID=UPI00235B2C99|nr:epidermal growth factor receptor substrate 15 isoform X2 [Bombina bombina]